MDTLIQISYFVAAFLFIFGLKRMSSPVTARGGIVWAGLGMVVATLITFFWPGMHNYALMTTAIFIGGIAAWYRGDVRIVAVEPETSCALGAALDAGGPVVVEVSGLAADGSNVTSTTHAASLLSISGIGENSGPTLRRRSTLAVA